jgi:outer membrane protein TolC
LPPALYELRQEVNDAFFTALLLESRAGELAALIADLEAQQHVVEARVREGAALPGEAATIEAELLRRRQDEAQVRADRDAVLTVLGQLTGRAIAEEDVLALPDLGSAVAAARMDTAMPRARPEYEQLERARERLARQAEAIAADERPRLSAFGRVGYGRPGLDLLSDRFQTYWLAGLRFEWPLWTWGNAERQREALELEQRVVATEEAALTGAIRRAVARDLATIDRLKAALATDDRIVTLRERIERETRARFQEGVVTAADYVARRSDVLTARLARASHRVELAQVGAHYLTTLGLEIPE